jgi:microcystin-dependent protein
MNVVIGEISLMPYHFVPRGWLPCDGKERTVSQETGDETLYHLLHPRFATGDGRYKLPDYSKMAPPNLRYCVAMYGFYPNPDYAQRERCIGEVGTFLMRSDFVKGPWERANGNAPGLPGANCLLAKTGEPKLPLAEAMAGSIRLIDVNIAGKEQPGWWPCDGRKIKVQTDESRLLLSLIGSAFGGDWNEFALPNLPTMPGLGYYINSWGPYPERP